MAIAVPDAEVLQTWAKGNGLEGDIKQLCQDEVILILLLTVTVHFATYITALNCRKTKKTTDFKGQKESA